MKLLALSPHLDDAVFSAGALLAALSREGHDVAVATCFTKSVRRPVGFALACQTDKGHGPDVDYMALRREEDARACRLLGLGYAHWPLLEAPHRGYETAAALFAGVRADDAAVVGALAQNLRDALGVYRPDVVLYPLGIGDHVDHLQVIAAVTRVREAGEGRSVRWLQWFDQPYLARHSGRYEQVLAKARPAARLSDVQDAGADYVFDFGADATNGGAAIGPEALSQNRRFAQAKHAACAAYVSQVGYQFFEVDGLPVAPEREWGRRIGAVVGSREWLRA